MGSFFVGDKGFGHKYFSAEKLYFLWSGIFCSSSLTKFHDLSSIVFVATKIYLRFAQVQKNPQKWEFLVLCAIRDSNPWPTPRQGVALPTELTAQYNLYYIKNFKGHLTSIPTKTANRSIQYLMHSKFKGCFSSIPTKTANCTNISVSYTPWH